MKHPVAKTAISLAILLTAASCAAGEGCPAPTPIVGGRYEFGTSAKPGADGRYPRGSLVFLDCMKGYKLQGGESVIYCTEDDEWSGSPTCQESRCAMPVRPWNGREIRFRRGRQVGGIAIFRCMEGFELIGSRRKRCSRTPQGLKWEGGMTECRATNSCANPDALPGANWTLVRSDRRSHRDDETFSPNTKINITCWPGHVSSVGQSIQITCGMSGEWNPPIPTCQEVICPSLLESEADIRHLQSNMENRTYRLGEVVDYHCDAGYRILGKTWRECSGPSLYFPNQTWSDLDPICSEIECPDPGYIQFGGSRYLESTEVGGSVRFRCRSGYSLQGTAVRYCQSDGQWNGTLTTCDHERFYCPNPGIPIGGRMVNSHLARFQKGERVSYECDRDKALIGTAERECLESGGWSGEPPTCQGPNDFEDTLKIAARLGYNIDSLAITQPQATISDNNSTGPSGRFIDLGYTQGMDIYFVFDASGSIPRAHFQYSLDLAKALISKVGGADGPRRARYGACVFASEAQVSFLVSDPQPSVDIVLTLIDELIDQHSPDEIGRGTATGKALQLVHETMIPAAHDRPNAKKYLFLFTDGNTNMHANVALPKYEAETLRERFKVQIHCIGVGEEIDRNELQEIASHPLSEHLFFIKDHGEMNLLAQTITRQKLDYSPCGYNQGLSDAVTPRIAGGEHAESGDWPWQVALFCDQNVAGCDDCVPVFFCGGSLIARNWVLSAAHCFKKCAVQDIRVYTGIIDKSRDSLLQFDPSKVFHLDGDDALIMHEAFNKHLDNDIALLRLSRNVTFNPYIRPICLPQENMGDEELYSTNKAPYVAGWGATDPYDLEGDCLDDTYRPTSPVLKELAVPVRTDQECRDSIQDHFRCSIVTAYKPAIAFCAGYSEGNLDACKGDSGGPVMRQLRVADGSRRWVQIGIVSWGEGCAQEGRFGIYTRLSAYKEWIHDHIGAPAYAIM